MKSRSLLVGAAIVAVVTVPVVMLHGRSQAGNDTPIAAHVSAATPRGGGGMPAATSTAHVIKQAGGSGGTGTSTPSTTAPSLRSGTATPAAVAVGVVVTTSCVQPGGTETVTVTSRPGLQVTVNPRYSDGQMGNVYGGLAVAQTIGPDGTYRETWTLGANAPAGPAVVEAGVASTAGPRVAGRAAAPFTVAARC